jgi:hypothetical protein
MARAKERSVSGCMAQGLLYLRTTAITTASIRSSLLATIGLYLRLAGTR